MKIFYQFSCLPPEIRIQIWSYSLPSYRVLRITSSNGNPNCDSEALSPRIDWKVDPCSYGYAHPALLSTYRESRVEALRHLTLKYKCYWNLNIDIPCICLEQPPHQTIRMLSDLTSDQASILKDVKQLAITFWPSEAMQAACIATLRQHHNISSLILIQVGAGSSLLTSNTDFSKESKPWKLAFGQPPYEYPETLAFKALKRNFEQDKITNKEKWLARKNIAGTWPVIEVGYLLGKKGTLF